MESLSTLPIDHADLDVWAFMGQHGIELVPAEHQYWVELFNRATKVLSIDRSGYCWTVRIPRQGFENMTLEETRKHWNRFLRKAGVRVSSHEPVICYNSTTLSFLFEYPGGEYGVGIEFARFRRGVLHEEFRRYRLDPPECYPPLTRRQEEELLNGVDED